MQKNEISIYNLFCRYKYTDDELQQVIEKAESMKSYNRDKIRQETDNKTHPSRYHYGLDLAQVDPVTESYILAAGLETEFLRNELDLVLKICCIYYEKSKQLFI